VKDLQREAFHMNLDLILDVSLKSLKINQIASNDPDTNPK